MLQGKRLPLERKHVQSLCVNREKGTEKKAEPNRSYLLPSWEAVSGYSWSYVMDEDGTAHGAPVVPRHHAVVVETVPYGWRLPAMCSSEQPEGWARCEEQGSRQWCSSSCWTTLSAAAFAPSALWQTSNQGWTWEAMGAQPGVVKHFSIRNLSLFLPSHLLTDLDSHSKLSLGFLKSQLLRACLITASLPNWTLPPLSLRHSSESSMIQEEDTAKKKLHNLFIPSIVLLHLITSTAPNLSIFPPKNAFSSSSRQGPGGHITCCPSHRRKLC